MAKMHTGLRFIIKTFMKKTKVMVLDWPNKTGTLLNGLVRVKSGWHKVNCWLLFSIYYDKNKHDNDEN